MQSKHRLSLQLLLPPLLIAYLVYQFTFPKMSGKSQTVSDLNKEFFNEKSKTYDTEEWTKRLAKVFTEEYRKHFDWYGVNWSREGEQREVRMLDFACGPGMTSFAFLDHVTEVKGLDISDGMVKEFNTRVHEKGISPNTINATAGDLLAEDPSTQPQIGGPEFHDFDFAVISFALHHIERPGFAIKRMVERLKPGGVVLVLDFKDELPTKDGKPVTEGPGVHSHGHGHGHGHGHKHVHGSTDEGKWTDQWENAKHTVTRQGFNKDEMEQIFRDAGCDETDYMTAGEPFVFGGTFDGLTRSAFLSRGRKAQ